MDKKLFGFAFIVLLVLSGVVSAYGMYGNADDYKINTYEPMPERTDVRYKQINSRVQYYQIGTYADVYSRFDESPIKMIPKEPIQYSSRCVGKNCDDISRDVIGYDRTYNRIMYWFGW